MLDNATEADVLAQCQRDYELHLRGSRALAEATVANYMADLAPFLEYLSSQGLSMGLGANSLKSFVTRNGAIESSREYRSLVRDYVAWLLERRPLKRGSTTRRRGHSRSSVQRMLAALRSFLRFLIDRHLLPDDPLWHPGSTLMARLTPKPVQRLPDLVSVAEAERLINAPLQASNKNYALRNVAVLELLYGCGLRVSEASDLDVEQLSLSNEPSVRVRGKGSKERQVPLGRQARNAIRAHLARSGSSSGPVFKNARGNRLSSRSIQHIVKLSARKAGLRETIHPHTLRHSFATHLLDGGADLRIVQELLGHSTPSATQVYTHVSQSEARRAYLNAHPLASAHDSSQDEPPSGDKS